ncbi:MAG: shikimate dehydrogenase [Kordiimonadales bacterium]|nr:MAG: shikimate dehydrogenase [Kordiimonadales bacterium]
MSKKSVMDNSFLKNAAVIGFPITQSLSPLIHEHWMEEVGIVGSYSAVEVDPGALADFVKSAHAKGLSGFNVTVPHKTEILQYLDTVAPLARQMGAVNTVKISADGKLSGFNTDGIGLVNHLKASVPAFPLDKPALILGAGGAARAAALGLLTEKLPMVMIANRTREKAEKIAIEIGRGRMTVVDWDERNAAVAAAGLIVNTTVLGMTGQHPLVLDLTHAAKDTVVYDIVYKPLETDLLKNAKSFGLRTVDGLGMLVLQGAAAFKIWFGHDVGFTADLRAKLEAQLP